MNNHHAETALPVLLRLGGYVTGPFAFLPLNIALNNRPILQYQNRRRQKIFHQALLKQRGRYHTTGWAHSTQEPGEGRRGRGRGRGRGTIPKTGIPPHHFRAVSDLVSLDQHYVRSNERVAEKVFRVQISELLIVELEIYGLQRINVNLKMAIPVITSDVTRG